MIEIEDEEIDDKRGTIRKRKETKDEKEKNLGRE